MRLGLRDQGLGEMRARGERCLALEDLVRRFGLREFWDAGQGQGHMTQYSEQAFFLCCEEI